MRSGDRGHLVTESAAVARWTSSAGTTRGGDSQPEDGVSVWSIVEPNQELELRTAPTYRQPDDPSAKQADEAATKAPKIQSEDGSCTSSTQRRSACGREEAEEQLGWAHAAGSEAVGAAGERRNLAAAALHEDQEPRHGLSTRGGADVPAGVRPGWRGRRAPRPASDGETGPKPNSQSSRRIVN